MEENLYTKLFISILFYIVIFLSWIINFKSEKIGQFRDYCLFAIAFFSLLYSGILLNILAIAIIVILAILIIYLPHLFRKLKSWLLNEFEIYKELKALLKITNEQSPDLTGINILPEENLISSNGFIDTIEVDESIKIEEPIIENIEEHLDAIIIDQEDCLTKVNLEAFTMPLIIELTHIKKNKSFTTKPNQTKITIIDKEVKEDQALKNKEIGYLGELYIMEYEKSFLSERNLVEFIPKIKHVSKEYDGYGYDIISFDSNGNEKYIEVKTTIQNEKSDFYLSQNEFETLHKLDNYFIYRLCNFDKVNMKAELIIIDCKSEFKKHFILIAETFKISKK